MKAIAFLIAIAFVLTGCSKEPELTFKSKERPSFFDNTSSDVIGEKLKVEKAAREKKCNELKTEAEKKAFFC
jgi:PBP1b-binding outer membrane lipoprotein LpoB